MSLGQVQRWVLSTLTVFTILHMSGGLVFAALVLDKTDVVGRVGLVIIAGLFGVVAIAAGLAIHKHRILSPWLLLGFIPTAIGLYYVLR
jgi:hypothetical protein